MTKHRFEAVENRRPHPRGGLVAAILVASITLGGCSDSTSPGLTAIPNVAGNYTLSESIPAATCTPNQLPPGGIVILEAFTQSYDVRIEQTGNTVRLIDVDFPDIPETGTIDASGKISFSTKDLFQETPREPNRIFFVDLTFTRDLQYDASTKRITGTGTAVNIFREGSATSAVFTTCSRQGITSTLTPRA